MPTKKIESGATQDPMSDVKVGRRFPYRNIVEEQGFKKQIRYGIREATRHYQHTTKCTDEEAALYRDVIENYFMEVSRHIIQKNYPYLWYKIGEFYISKFNGSPLLNSLQSKKNKRLVSFVNLHTAGWIFQFYWARARAVFHNNAIYEFKPVEGIPEVCGKKGVKEWIRKLHREAKLTDYNAFVRNGSMVWKRRKKREEENKKRLEKKQEILDNLKKIIQ